MRAQRVGVSVSQERLGRLCSNLKCDYELISCELFAEGFSFVMGVVYLHVRTLFHIDTVGRIVLKLDKWLGSMRCIQFICTCARADEIPYLRNCFDRLC